MDSEVGTYNHLLLLGIAETLICSSRHQLSSLFDQKTKKLQFSPKSLTCFLISFSKLDLPLEKKIVGTVGRLAYPKEPEDFIQIAQLISRRRDDTIFVHAGGGVQRNAIERMIQELGLGRMVFLLGPRKDIEKIFSIFDVFLLTSVWEGLPIVIPQAIASGVPVVSTDVGGIREIIKHGKGGFLTKPGNIHDLAFFVEKLLDDEELRSRFVTYSDKIVNEFTHKRMIEDIENLYLDLVGKI